MQVIVKRNEKEEDVFDTNLLLMALLRPDGFYTAGAQHDAGLTIENLMDAMESIMSLVLHYTEKCYLTGVDEEAITDETRARLKAQVMEFFERRVKNAVDGFRGKEETVDLMSLAQTILQ